jgi:hypothetical protein
VGALQRRVVKEHRRAVVNKALIIITGATGLSETMERIASGEALVLQPSPLRGKRTDTMATPICPQTQKNSRQLVYFRVRSGGTPK